MRTLYLTAMIFCHILVSSFILYSTIASASPLNEQSIKAGPAVEPPKNVVANAVKQTQEQPIHYAAAAPKSVDPVGAHYKPEETAAHHHHEEMVQPKSVAQQKSNSDAAPKTPVVADPVSAESAKQPTKYIDLAQQQQEIVPKAANKEQSPINVADKQQSPAAISEEKKSKELIPDAKSAVVDKSEKVYEAPKSEAVPALSASVQERLVAEPVAAPVAELKQDKKPEQVIYEAPKSNAPIQEPAAAAVVASPPAVKGGLGPLHLLAATLCSYQPHKPVSDETLTYLYNQRAAQRKNLFQFMSLKFTNLDKLTSHLNAGSLEVVKTVDSSESSLVRSHGWPVVGNCTAHYLKLMAEAAWCDCVDEPHCLRDSVEQQKPRLMRRSAALVEQQQPQTSSVISKLMHVADIKEAPIVESSQQQQQQRAPVQPASVASTRQCRRNALRLAKALFNHLAENQTQISESWPRLSAELSQDECARKRMIDIVTALSTFRGESTQVHRDNIEFAFAMDDLRGKVLENEVNTPLTFDKQVIEVEQFLQQSVRLMLANIDPKRAKLTSMRYRSLHAPVSADDQCIELHQRLLAKNYPDECNPNQYGPLPDVLRMTALSLDLWSIEQDLSKYTSSQFGLQKAAPKQQDVNECIANLVAN